MRFFDLDYKNSQTYDDTLCCVIEDILCHDAALGLDKIWNLLRNVSHHSQNECKYCLTTLSYNFHVTLLCTAPFFLPRYTKVETFIKGPTCDLNPSFIPS